MRRRAAPKRKITPDPLFRSQKLAKFINIVMTDGKKSIAEKIVYRALEKVVAKKHKKDAVDFEKDDKLREEGLYLFDEVMGAIAPSVEVKSRRVGGATYQVPVPVRDERRIALAMRWLKDFAKKRGEKTMVERLANEIDAALSGNGGAVKKREEVHRMAKANQAFAHFRW